VIGLDNDELMMLMIDAAVGVANEHARSSQGSSTNSNLEHVAVAKAT